jgi:nicotinate-nucleotide pyrophosphorylase (carboxylating)
VEAVVRRALAEDLEPLGDITSALLPPGLAGRATVVPRAPGVLAGRTAADEAFRQVDPELVVTWAADDGDDLEVGRAVATVEGPLASILTAERTALNLLCHLSGIATLTRRYVDAAGGRIRVWDTRKTTPGLRALEKAAVRAGGGVNHRGNLSDWVMFKDNHLAALGVAAAVQAARDRWPGKRVHVECDTAEQVAEAVAAGADLVLLDNMAPDEVAACVRTVRAGAPSCLVEVSGGVTLETVPAYAATGADLISVGALTHSAPVLDLGLDIATTSPGGPA